jgi:hypothetical protein
LITGPTSNGEQPDARNPDGTFATGNNANPGGRPRGARHKVTRAIEELLEGEHEALTRKAIEKALEGDMTALRLCLDRLAPPRKDAPISTPLPIVRNARDALEASNALLAAVSSGEVTPDEGGRVMALLTAHKGILETADLEARIAALEGKTR